MYSLKLNKFHRKTHVLQSFFNKVAGLRAFNFIKKKYQRSCFPVKFVKFFRTPTFKNICERLLLYLHVILFAIHEKDTANTMRGWNPLKQTWWFFFLENSCDLLFPQKRSIIDIWHDSKCRGGPPKVLYNKQWSYKFWKIRRKKPVIESLKEETLAQVFSCEFWRTPFL